MAQFYFSSKNVLGFGQHAYLVYDPDGDLGTLEDQNIFRGGPAGPSILGNIIIEPGFLNYNSSNFSDVSEDSLDQNENGLVDAGDLTTADRFYYDLGLSNAGADKVIIENWINSFGLPIQSGDPSPSFYNENKPQPNSGR